MEQNKTVLNTALLNDEDEESEDFEDEGLEVYPSFDDDEEEMEDDEEEE